MALVRVFIPTYRRRHLLERAVASLRAQTCADWICELHNDDPADDGPHQLLERLGDRRFRYFRHERNLGGTATFNLFFRATAEPFYAMLEDDNAWEPEFLATMLAVARQNPDVTVFWCNQQLWREDSAGGVQDTGRCVHDGERDGPPQRFAWGQPAQLLGASHAHGAALFRSRPGDAFITPAVPIALVEAFRERALPHPLVFVPQPLAQFTQTLQSARSDDRGEWAVMETMLAATFLKHAHYGPAATAEVWHRARTQQPRATGTLLSAALADPACRPLLRQATAVDWLRFLRGVVHRPGVLPLVLRAHRQHPDWYDYLERHTAARFAAA